VKDGVATLLVAAPSFSESFRVSSMSRAVNPFLDALQTTHRVSPQWVRRHRTNVQKDGFQTFGPYTRSAGTSGSRIAFVSGARR
jgi:hypothetical protein